MPTLLLRFPSGRYHATPWGHHVNEGLIEWPPSPWRLLRALIACGYATQDWSEVPLAGRRLIEALSDTLPHYRLPPATAAHSRHYMPLGVLDKGDEKTTLVFDAWADVGDGEMVIRWNCPLDSESLALFGRLASRLGYLGRSESWVLAKAIADDGPLPAGTDAYPHVDGQHGEREWEQVSLMAPEPAARYKEWRDRTVARLLDQIPAPIGQKSEPRRTLTARQNAAAPYPQDLVECLEKDTAWWKGHRWSQPPGSRRVLYWRRSDALSVGTPLGPVRKTAAPVQMMLLALTTRSGARGSLPARARALPQAELLHRALVASVAKGTRVECPELTGKDSEGRPLVGHQHAHLLPADFDGDGHLDHFVVYAPMGLGTTAQRAVRSLKRTWTKGGAGDLQLAVSGQGCLQTLRTLPESLRAGVNGLLGERGGSTTWTSVSPFVPPRFLKKRGANTLAGQIQAELASRGFPGAMVEILPWADSTRDLRHVVRVRRYPANPPPVDAGFAIRLVFNRPVVGPIALGYGAHFGLGLFWADSTTA